MADGTAARDRLAIDWRIVIGFWLAVCAIFAARMIFANGGLPLISDTDDAMRLTIVRDLLHGQNWFDHVQHRLNTPYGAPIHWSRFIDLGIAALELIFTPFFGANAYLAAATSWPLLLMLVLLWVSALLTTHLVGRDGLLPGLVLPVFSAVVLVEFAPGRVDHHSVQIILSLVMAYATLRAWTQPRFAILAGLAAATTLAIGLETLPLIVPAVLAFGLAYVLDPEQAAQMRRFGLSFGLGTLVHLMLALPPADWFSPACDAISITYAAAALGVGLVFVILPVLPLRAWGARLGAGIVLGGALLAALLVAFPDCLDGPYAGMDPWLAEHWLNHIVEAKPVWYSLAGLPAYTIGIMVPPLLGLIVIAWRVWHARGIAQAEWATLGLFLLCGLLVTLAEVRGVRLVAPLAVPAGGWLIVQARQRYLGKRGLINILGLVGAWLGFAGLAISLLAGWVLPNGSDEVMANAGGAGTRFDCLVPDAFADLAGLPPERIMAPVDLGAHLLLYTPHAVVGAPYHRNQQGVLDTFRFFNEPLDQARRILGDRGISLIVTCPLLPEMQGFPDTAPGSFVRLAADGKLPDWLEETSLPGAVLKTYQVVD